MSQNAPEPAKMTLEEAMSAVELVKEQINQHDAQSSQYKTSLRTITAAISNATTTSKEPNTVTIEWVKVDLGTIVAPPNKLLLQLSSPIEEATLYLPPTASSSTTTFSGVETGQATLSMTLEWDTATATKSETTFMDVSKFTHELLNVSQLNLPSSTAIKLESYETTLRIPILPIGKTNAGEAEALCTVTMNVKYVPSYKDIREELCDCIGKIATQKAIAREELRKASLMVHELSSHTKNNNPKPTTAVRSGFLQKNSKSTATTTTSDAATTATGTPTHPWYTGTMEWCRRTVTNTLFLAPMVKNYIFFIAFTVVTHYYGHQLAIPPPV